ncbi:28962_t:CDS:2 [Gigaspora margarita]|uniref:28962_t:CDS:1 n=1 Tax=Gigaspora margarita TaxID=4874 RepID=A0ABM8W330_GIGMA|nr:28962_t:CDS:2 [Gigaspora margarita]
MSQTVYFPLGFVDNEGALLQGCSNWVLSNEAWKRYNFPKPDFDADFSKNLFVIRNEGIEGEDKESEYENVVVRDEVSVGNGKNEKEKPKRRDKNKKGVVIENEDMGDAKKKSGILVFAGSAF